MRLRWGSAGLLCAQRLLAGLLLLGGATLCPLRAQTSATKTAHQPDRYLLIVETSKSMQRRTDAVLGTVWYLLGSGLNGQFRDGGTLGVWTFNQDLSAGIFPLQTWSSSAQKDITQRTITFLKGQKYGKRANFDEVALALSRVIEASDLITVVLISSGDSKIHGTPFDDRINAAYQQFRGQQQKARMPFVTVLRARHGQVVDYIVNTPPWPLQVPRLAEDTKGAEAPQDKRIEALHNAPSATVPPLIVSGKKPKPEPAPAPKPQPAPAKAELPPPAVSGTVSSEPAVVKRPEPAAPPVEVAKVEPAPVVATKPAAEPMPKPVPEPKPVSEPRTETVKVPETKAIEPVPAKPQTVPPPPAPTPKPEPAPARAEPPPPVVAGTVAKEPAVMKRSEPAAPPAEVAKVEPAPVVPAKPATEPPPRPVPAPKPVNEPKAETVKAPEAKATEPAPAKPEVAQPTPAPKPMPGLAIVQQPKPSPAPEVKTGLAPAPAAIPMALPGATPTAAVDQVTTSNSSSLAPPPSSRPAPPAQSATAAPGEVLMRTGIILIAAVLLAFVVIGFAFLLTRRWRPAPQGSLITRSFEREKRP